MASSRVRVIGIAAALTAWLLLATHVCIDVGGAHAVPAQQQAHAQGNSHGGPPGHADCAPALSADRDPGYAPIATDLGSVAVGLDVAKPARQAPLAFPDAARSRSAPLYLLHAALLI